MYSFFVLNILLSAVFLVQCQEFSHSEGEKPHEYSEVKNCAAERNQIIDNRGQAVLKPRERFVTLIPHPNYEYNPRAVIVKRCNGHCKVRWSPMPMSTVMKSFIVHLHREGNPMAEKCVAVQVAEHTSCRCMCMGSGKNCTPLQYWDKASCACLCQEREMKKLKCEKYNHGKWDEMTCKCL